MFDLDYRRCAPSVLERVKVALRAGNKPSGPLGRRSTNGSWSGSLSRPSKANGMVVASPILAKRSLSAGDLRLQLESEHE